MNSDEQWMLVSHSGVEYPLPQTMIFLGREECDVTLQSPSVDKRHAVITYDHYEKRFKVKDLNSVNGTYVNDTRIPEQTYMKLEHSDTVRFGYDPTVYHIQCLQQEQIFSSGDRILSDSKTDGNRDSKTQKVLSAMAETQNVRVKSERLQISSDEDIRRRNKEYSSAMISSLVSNASSSGDLSSTTDLCNNTVGIPTNRLVGCTQEGNVSGFHSAHSDNHHSSHQTICNSDLHVTLPPANSGQQHDQTKNPHTGGRPSVVPSGLEQALNEALSIAPGLISGKFKPESTSSNTSLQSAFSGDSLDQLVESTSDKQERSKSLPANKLDLFFPSPANNSGKSAKNRAHPSTKGQTATSKDIGSKSETSPRTDCHSSDISPASSDKVIQRVPATAFTIDFDDVKSDSTKKLDIKDSISKFAPLKADSERLGHRRNSSLGKVDEHKVLEICTDENWNHERRKIFDRVREGRNKGDQLSPELGSEKDYSVSTQKKIGNLRRGYHSEGYFSSDQDDDLSSKSELMGSKRSRFVDRDNVFVQHVLNSSEKHKLKNKDATRSVNSSAAFLINKMLNSAVKETLKKNNVTEKNSDFVPTSTKQEVLVKHTSLPNTSETWARPSVLNVTSSCSEKNSVKIHSSEEIKDNVSESGTYTIDKESPNLELEEARRNIDRVFGITVEENEDNEEEAVITGPRPPFLQDLRESLHSPESESSKSKLDSSSKRSSPMWMQSNHSASVECEISSSQSTITAHKTISNSTTNGLNGLKLHFSETQQRPRRKLPTPPVDKLPFSLAISRVNDIIEDGVSSENEKPSSKTVHVTTPTDACSFDTERHLRDTESLVSAMEARMDHKSLLLAMGSSFESRDSGGESDVDTSTASYCNDKSLKQDRNLGKRLGTQLKSKLKQLDNAVQRSAVKNVSKTSTRPPLICPGQKLVGSQLHDQENIVLSDNETASVASDISSSSDVSGSPRPHRKRSEKLAPTMKFNRAFSLRRARLGYSSDGGTEKGKTVCSSTSTRMTSIQTTSKVKAVEGSKKTETGRSRLTPTSTVNLSRNDGGRFSLRVAKNVKGTSTSSGKAEDSLKSKHRSLTTTSNVITASRSNSTLSSKEVEMKNWRRRKEYDPMKAAAEGRKKEAAKKAAVVDSHQITETPTSSNACLQRSASFHGTEGFRIRRTTYTSEDDMMRSLEDEAVINATCHDDGDDYPPDVHTEYQSSKTMSKTDEEYPGDSSGFRTHSHADLSWNSSRTALGGSSYRHKNKFEALDSLVITTIHQLSSKLCGYTEGVLSKVKDQCKTSSDKCHYLEDLISNLSSPETPLSPNTRNTSRELAGTLKNLKKLETGLQAIERIMPVASKPPSGSQKCNGIADNEFY